MQREEILSFDYSKSIAKQFHRLVALHGKERKLLSPSNFINLYQGGAFAGFFILN